MTDNELVFNVFRDIRLQFRLAPTGRPIDVDITALIDISNFYGEIYSWRPKQKGQFYNLLKMCCLEYVGLLRGRIDIEKVKEDLQPKTIRHGRK